jgi:transketolase
MNLKYLTTQERHDLDEFAFQIRAVSLEFITTSSWGHIGGSFSEAELLACLYGGAMTITPGQPDDPQRDRFILSKAHASPGLYAALALKGFFPVEKLYRYCRLHGLDGHTQRNNPAGMEYSGGSLGTGLSYAAGVASALRLNDQLAPRVLCLVGDGECTEGQIWEAALFAAHRKLDNLVAIIDYNKLMAKGRMSEMIGIEPLEEKWTAFGWQVISIDGHDVVEICRALHRAYYLEHKGRPVCIVAHTVKGRGVPECEYNSLWHTHAPGKEKAEAFLANLRKTFGRPDAAFRKPLTKEGGNELHDVIIESLTTIEP